MTMNWISENVGSLPFATTPSRMKIGSGTMSGDRNRLNECRDGMWDFVRNAVASQGMRALENPRSSALVHEAGHAVVYAHFGFAVRRCKIWRDGAGGNDWVGFTTTDRKWRSDSFTAPEEDLREAICLLAGVNAEKRFDPLNFRLASSVDEIAQANGLAFNVAFKLGCEQETAMEHISRVTTDILVENKAIVFKVAAVLDEKENVWGERLATLLAGVMTRGDIASLSAPLRRRYEALKGKLGRTI